MNRDILTLLKLTLEKIKIYGITSGLCGLIYWDLYIDGSMINEDEVILLLNYIESKKPEGAKMFWWPCGSQEPRVEFLENLIKQLEDEETSH